VSIINKRDCENDYTSLGGTVKIVMHIALWGTMLCTTFCSFFEKCTKSGFTFESIDVIYTRKKTNQTCAYTIVM